MAYNHKKIEQKWQNHWQEKKVFAAEDSSDKEKYYILDMFPYPSGSGLHVGHPLGYVATDILARFKRHNGFNVLHPMGWDAFGLPAEQYAIKTGTHPSITTKQNIKSPHFHKTGISIYRAVIIPMPNMQLIPRGITEHGQAIEFVFIVI